MPKRKVIIYTDGSAVSNKNCESYGLGGYGIYIRIEQDDRLIKELFFREGFSNTKTGRMELKAIIEAFKKVKDKLCQVFLYSDSEYALRSVNDGRLWVWEKLDWKNIANPDLMQEYLMEYRKFRYKPIMKHIKGHQTGDDENIIGNNIADALANYKTQKNFKRDL